MEKCKIVSLESGKENTTRGLIGRLLDGVKTNYK